MKERITTCIIIVAIGVVFPIGCFFDEKGTTSKTETTSPGIYIEIPSMQRTFTEGYPKKLVARTYANESYFNHVDLVWTSDLDGEIGVGKVITTDILSIGKHVITLAAYDENNHAVTSQIEVKKVERPGMPEFKKEAEKPMIYVDRVSHTTFIDNRDGTVLDKGTGLMWLITDDGYDRAFVEAYNYCLDLELAGFKDWRLPTLNELEGIANIGYLNLEPIICEVFETKNNGSYWTQTESDFKISSMPNTRHFAFVKFSWMDHRKAFVGETVPVGNEFTPRYARCVRVAQ